MQFQLSLYLLPLAIAAVVSALLSAVVFGNRHQRTAPQTFGVLFAAAIWATADAMRLASVDPAAQLFWHNARFFGSTLVVFAVFLHAVEYTNRERWITPRTVTALGSVFVVTLLLVWTEAALGHGLIRLDQELVQVGALELLRFEYGAWFYLNAGYSYLLLAATAGLFALESLRRTGTYRLQAAGLFLGTTIPWGMNGLYLAGYSPVDLTAFGFTVTGFIYVAQLYRFQLLDVVPIARSTVVNHIESGYLVVDTEDRVLDVNQAAADLLGRPREAVIGATVDDLFGDYPAVSRTFGGRVDVRDDVTLTQDGERRDYDVDISPVFDDHGQRVGRVVLIRDVTEQRRRQRTLERRTEALERQNERLDQFASVVSHDLRNPVGVAKGHLEIARAEDDDNSFDRVEDALDRVEEITDDVLGLARQEREAVDGQAVDLADLAEEAWKTVETGAATLDVETSRTVRADPGRLRRALENLFRNAVEHGPDDVTVRVGDTADGGGFYVEDDGPGVATADRESVFDPGYTTDELGTGFGLAIVDATAAAHGWSVGVVEGREDGARFEFTGLEESGTAEAAADPWEGADRSFLAEEEVAAEGTTAEVGAAPDERAVPTDEDAHEKEEPAPDGASS
jgi:PAS domain S-box-containing protein